jgi:hypothetical protein
MSPKLSYGARMVVGLVALYAAAQFNRSGNADRANEWLIGLWPFRPWFRDTRERLP